MPDRARRLLLFAAAVACGAWSVFALRILFFPHFPATPPPQDFTYYIVGARVGMEHGWSRIYDLQLQQHAFSAIRGKGVPFTWATVFVSLPPIAWLVAPLALLPYPTAYWVWVSLLVVLYFTVGAVVLPGDRLTRGAVLAAGIWIHPLLTGLQMGQNSLLVALAVAVAMVLLAGHRDTTAGVVLGLAVVLKPQVAAVVPLALLLWGARQAFIATVLTVTFLAVVSVGSLGPTGIAELRTDLALEQGHLDNAVWTPAIVFGLNNVTLAVQALALALGIAAALLARRRAPEYAAVAGLLATLLVVGYHHEHDFVGVLIAGWLWLRTSPRAVHFLLVAPTFVALAAAPATGPAPIIIVTMADLVLLVGALGFVRLSSDPLTRAVDRDRLMLEQVPAPAGPVEQ